MPAQQPASEPARPGGQRVPLPEVPEPDSPSPLHPEAPGPGQQAQIVAVGTDRVRGYLAGVGTPAEEIDDLIAEAHRAGAVTFACPPAPGRPAERLKLSFAGEAYQLAIETP
jgi:hypothetical protein